MSDPLVYRTLGEDGDPWPPWLGELKHATGAYVIRDPATGRALYVGSSSARLYDTITRHFQQWRRKKKWWSGAYGAGHDPGLTYKRSRCHVAVRLTAKGDHLTAEADLIARLAPRDNLVERPDGRGEEAPF